MSDCKTNIFPILNSLGLINNLTYSLKPSYINTAVQQKSNPDFNDPVYKKYNVSVHMYTYLPTLVRPIR